MAGRRSRRRMRYIRSLEEIPRFANEAAEAAFWATQSLAAIWDKLEPVQAQVSPTGRRFVQRQSGRSRSPCDLKRGRSSGRNKSHGRRA